MEGGIFTARSPDAHYEPNQGGVTMPLGEYRSLSLLLAVVTARCASITSTFLRRGLIRDYVPGTADTRITYLITTSEERCTCLPRFMHRDRLCFWKDGNGVCL